MVGKYVINDDYSNNIIKVYQDFLHPFVLRKKKNGCLFLILA